MSDRAVKFIRKDGRIIPIAAAAGAGAAAISSKTRAVGKIVKGARIANAAVHAARFKKGGAKPEFKVNRGMDAIGLGLSVLSGGIAAATFSGGAKGLAGGAIASHALDAVGVAANISSVAGKGNAKARAKQAAKQEARNFVVGNAVYAAGVLGFKKNRQALGTYAQKIIAIGRKALRV